jgi:hypothetical protein
VEPGFALLANPKISAGGSGPSVRLCPTSLVAFRAGLPHRKSDFRNCSMDSTSAQGHSELSSRETWVAFLEWTEGFIARKPRSFCVLCFSFASGEPTGNISVESITQQVKAEIAKLNQVLRLLADGPKETTVTTQMGAPRQKLSASARRRMSAAQKAQWAKLGAGEK